MFETNRKIKILIIITTAFIPYGGLTTVMMNYYRAIDKSGLHIDFASTNEAENVLLNELKEYGSKYWCLGDRNHNPIQYGNNLYRLLKKNKYDVVHVNANSATASIELAIAKMCGVAKRIVHIHNSTGSHIKLHHLLQPIFCSLYTDAVACSKKAGKWAFEYRTFTVLNNAVNTKKFAYNREERSTLRRELGISENCYVIGHLGKINKQKNHQFLIDVFNKYCRKDSDSILLLAGDGPLRQKIEDRVKAFHLEDKVIFLGMIPDVNRYLSVMDCIVFPSLWEGLPLSLVEAQANGLRCIFSLAVTQEANVTGKAMHLNIDAGADMWANAIGKIKGYDRGKEANDNLVILKKKGYDVSENTKVIESMYRERFSV